MTMMKIRFLKRPGYYNGNYPEGSVVMVDENFGKYAVGLGDAELANAGDPITDPIPYTMAVRTTGAEESLAIIADALRPKVSSGKETG